MMTKEQATQVAALFTAIGGCNKVEVDSRGHWSEVKATDSVWFVWLWIVNSKAGNRNCEKVEHIVSEKEAKLIAKKAKGKATERDNAALARMAAERSVNAE